MGTRLSITKVGGGGLSSNTTAQHRKEQQPPAATTATNAEKQRYHKDFDKPYTIGKLLGHGQFGYTCVAINKVNADSVTAKKNDKNKNCFGGADYLNGDRLQRLRMAKLAAA
ncbi:hypothetical protein GOBAR_AA11326 [Gossypium barbadense]|uniref:Protein kinase domain-containing protein n=1 Tax=Gossypium barbadense TaxID=3634 RepID=A0A2P5Y168_GOSBA|nr:hypothetical protein GOBAR_AA11326 [Gossypium barbadense]